MIRVYGSPLCPDCWECKVNFDRHGIAYEEIDITAGMRQLKAIEKEDGGVTLDWEGFLAERNLPVVYREERPACRIDGSGC